MLSDPVAEAFSLIHRHPSGENFCSSRKVVFISDTNILGGIDSPKKQKKKTTLVVKPRSMIILEVNIRKKVTCVFKIFLMYFIHVQYLITEYLRSYF